MLAACAMLGDVGRWVDRHNQGKHRQSCMSLHDVSKKLDLLKATSSCVFASSESLTKK
jgi:hypothetical protein